MAAGGALNPELGIGTRFIQGAEVGGGAGGLIGGGQAMENGGNALDVAKGVGGGTLAGAALGGTLNAVLPPVFGKISDTITPKSENPTISTEGTLQSRIQDATPVYDEKMIGQHVMTPDTVDAQGNPIKGPNAIKVSRIS